MPATRTIRGATYSLSSCTKGMKHDPSPCKLPAQVVLDTIRDAAGDKGGGETKAGPALTMMAVVRTTIVPRRWAVAVIVTEI